MKILSVGWFDRVSNTSLHRNNALVQNFGEVDMVDCSFRANIYYKIINKLFNFGFPLYLPDLSGANKKIKRLVEKNHYDIVWIDKGTTINKSTLEYIKKVNCKTIIASFSPDNMALRHNQSQNYLDSIPLYDYIYTNKSYILEEMRSLGARNIQFVNNMYEDSFHYPRDLSPNEIEELSGEVGFIGVWEKERCKSILYLVDNGINVTVFGEGKWISYKNYAPNLVIKPAVFSENYSKAIRALKISLCFLRKMNFDQQTTRTMEIPACGGFMLAERTKEHLSLFEEGYEADFFSSDEELLKKCKYYLENEKERNTIVIGGIKRCETSGYSNKKTMHRLITNLIK